MITLITLWSMGNTVNHFIAFYFVAFLFVSIHFKQSGCLSHNDCFLLFIVSVSLTLFVERLFRSFVLSLSVITIIQLHRLFMCSPWLCTLCSNREIPDFCLSIEKVKLFSTAEILIFVSELFWISAKSVQPSVTSCLKDFCLSVEKDILFYCRNLDIRLRTVLNQCKEHST